MQFFNEIFKFVIMTDGRFTDLSGGKNSGIIIVNKADNKHF